MTISPFDHWPDANPYLQGAHRRRHAIRRPKRSDEPARRRAACLRMVRLISGVVAVVCGMVVVIGWVG